MNFENIRLVPRHLSNIDSRDDVDLSVQIGEHLNSLPILVSPMNTVCSFELLDLFWKKELIGSTHRFSPNNEEMFKAVRLSPYYGSEMNFPSGTVPFFLSIGLHGFSTVDLIFKLTPKENMYYFIVDVANGFNSAIEPIIAHLCDSQRKVFIVAGNVAGREGYEYLAELGVDAVRVGIGNGSYCATTTNTGIGQNLVDSVIECYDASLKMKNPPLIIADGGIKTVGDIAKTLAVGADLIMTGSMFAGCEETPGNVIVHDGNKYKQYYGSASYPAQSARNNSTKYIEGFEGLVKYKGSAQKVLDSIDSGLRSAFSYIGASNVEEFKHNCLNCVKFV